MPAVFEAMREISSIEGDPDLLNHAMALMLSRYRLLGMRFALHWGQQRRCVPGDRHLCGCHPAAQPQYCLAAGFFLSMSLLICCYGVFFRDIRLANRATHMYIERLFAATHH